MIRSQRISSAADDIPPHTLTRQQRYDYDTSLVRMPHSDPKSFGMLLNQAYSFEIMEQAAPTIVTDIDGKVIYYNGEPIQADIVPFYTRQQQKENTVVIYPDQHGIPRAQLANGETLANKKLNFVMLSQYTDKEKTRLIVGPLSLHHSHLSQGEPIQYGGEIEFNSGARLDSFNSITFTTGHYRIPEEKRAIDYAIDNGFDSDALDNMFDNLGNFEARALKKFSLLIDNITSTDFWDDNVSTVAYGLEDQATRLQNEFPEYKNNRNDSVFEIIE